MHASFETDWKSHGTCWEAVEGIFNYAAHLHLARPHDYMGLAMLRAGHQIRWFSGVARGPKEQGTLLERWCNEAFLRNSQCAKQSKPPPDYEELVALAKRTCNAAGLPYERALQAGDPYCGRPAQTQENDGNKSLRELELKVEKMEKERKQAGGAGGSAGGAGGRREDRWSRERGRSRRGDGERMGKSLEEKVGFTCKKWNSRGGCDDKRCDDKHQCSRVVNGMLCWGSHPEYEHPNK